MRLAIGTAAVLALMMAVPEADAGNRRSGVRHSRHAHHHYVPPIVSGFFVRPAWGVAPHLYYPHPYYYGAVPRYFCPETNTYHFYAQDCPAAADALVPPPPAQPSPYPD